MGQSSDTSPDSAFTDAASGVLQRPQAPTIPYAACDEQSQEELRILYDDSRDSDGDELAYNYRGFRNVLIGEGIEADLVEINNGPITPELLETADIFIINDNELEYSSAEIDALQQFVDSGRCLFVMGEHSRAHAYENLNSLLSPYGIGFTTWFADDLWDEWWAPLGYEPNFVRRVFAQAGGALEVGPPAERQARTAPPGEVVVAITRSGIQRVVTLGDSDIMKHSLSTDDIRLLHNIIAFCRPPNLELAPDLAVIRHGEAGADSFSFGTHYQLDDPNANLDPVQVDTRVELGSYGEMIPAGSFVETEPGTFVYEAPAPGVTSMTVTGDTIDVRANDVDLSGTKIPTEIFLQFGRVRGDTLVRPEGTLECGGQVAVEATSGRTFVLSPPEPVATDQKLEESAPAPDVDAPLIYNEQLVTTSFEDGLGVYGTTERHNRRKPDTWEYYWFYGNQGDVVEIQVDRLTAAMDPAMQLCAGTSDSTAGISAFGRCGPDMSFVASADDNNGVPHNVGGYYADPRLEVELPRSGRYTLAVFDYFGKGPVPEFEIHARGLGGAPMACLEVLAARMTFEAPNEDWFTLTAEYELASGSNGIDPATEPVTLLIGPMEVTLPAGSFDCDDSGSCIYESSGPGVTRCEIGDGLIRIEGSGLDLAETTNPNELRVSIGDDDGCCANRFEGVLRFNGQSAYGP
jgi:hypothetical protein